MCLVNTTLVLTVNFKRKLYYVKLFEVTVFGIGKDTALSSGSIPNVVVKVSIVLKYYSFFDYRLSMQTQVDLQNTWYFMKIQVNVKPKLCKKK